VIIGSPNACQVRHTVEQKNSTWVWGAWLSRDFWEYEAFQ
jgi:hypothetical protein